MQKTGKIGVTTDNIFPIIKKFLYSEHEIFLRELVSNAVDATQKMKAVARTGEYKGDLGDVTVRVKIDKEAKTLTISDAGIGMTQEEIDKYINQIAFSSAGEFLDKYKNDIDAIIGHFGLGFYSSFMVSKQVDIITKSYKEGAQAVKWSCDGTPDYTIEEVDKATRGTDIVLHLDAESEEFLEDSRVEGLLKRYCKFLPVEIGFGTEKEWKEDKYEDTGKDKIVNNPNPIWNKKPADLKDEDYKGFYKELYPESYEDPLFNIHLNVDYPFNLTGVLYFPRIRTNLEIQRNKIQLYCNQVFVTDSVEGIVPEYLTLLHGVLDSPDIPLNVSRSYLQGDPNVKKISSHITKKVADKLNDIFKSDRAEFEKKWDDLKMFIQYGILTDEKFFERVDKFFLFKNLDGKYFTMEEYKNLVEANQTDKDKKIVYLYVNNQEDQHTFIQAAKDKGYDILLMDGQLDSHFINNMEPKMEGIEFRRVDADVVDKLIRKEEAFESKLSMEQEQDLRPVFKGALPEKDIYMVAFEPMDEKATPVLITQSEFMRRMKDMHKLSGTGGYYGNLPDSYNLVVNTNHPLVERVLSEKDGAMSQTLSDLNAKITGLEAQLEEAKKANEGKKEEEISQEDKDKQESLEADIREAKDEKEGALSAFGKESSLVKQLIDLALLSNNMLKGEALTRFVRRSVDLIK